MQFLYPCADVVVAISHTVAKTMIEHNICTWESIKVIGNPVTLRQPVEVRQGPSEVSIAPAKEYIVAVGRLDPEKGFDVLLEAFNLVKNKRIALVIVGEGKMRTLLEARARELGISSRVHLTGFLRNPFQLIENARLFVLPSRWEGFSLALVEALQLGVPIVSTDCLGAPRELLMAGKLGHLVTPDNIHELSSAIDEALICPRGKKHERISRGNEFAANLIARQYIEHAFVLPIIKDIEVS
jgi:glycosyltransferase involved in cell wall biosynthesis